MEMQNKIDLFLDSGAFSAWTQKTEINIQDYIQFIKDNQQYITIYANLDVIGSAEGTWENQQIMEDAGLKPLPVYHFKEDPKWLKRYLKKGYDYIALGGLVKAGDIIPFLNDTFSKYLCDDQGMPIIKVHGFGLTSIPIMLKYPWYSVDSTSWVVTGRMGSIFMPSIRHGKYYYDEASLKITVSNRSPAQKEAGAHINTLTPLRKSLVLEYIRDKGYALGRSEYKKESQSYQLKDGERWAEKKPKDKAILREVEIIIEPGISNMYQLRDEMNIIYFLDLEKSMPPWPWPFKTKQLPKGFL